MVGKNCKVLSIEDREDAFTFSPPVCDCIEIIFEGASWGFIARGSAAFNTICLFAEELNDALEHNKEIRMKYDLGRLSNARVVIKRIVALSIDGVDCEIKF